MTSRPPNQKYTTANTPPNKMQEVTMKQKIIALATFLIALLVVMGATLQELLTPLLVLLVGYLIIFLRQEKGG